jgi:hypothetical protein
MTLPNAHSREIMAAWSALRDYLRRLSEELSEEVRAYPAPLARCDVQLTRLIEERTRAIEQLKVLSAADPRRSETALASLEFLLAEPQVHADDELEGAIRTRLSAAIESLRVQRSGAPGPASRGRSLPEAGSTPPARGRSRSTH